MTDKHFFVAIQNNSSGIYKYNKKAGLNEAIIINAHDYKMANEALIKAGAYFAGVDQGLDCSCCGDRWLPFEEDDAMTFEDAALYPSGIIQAGNVSIIWGDGKIETVEEFLERDLSEDE